MKDLKIALIQSDLVWEDKKANLSHFSGLIQGIEESVDLVVLSEMFSTGFSMNATGLGETESGETQSWMKKMSNETQAVICGSLIIEEDGKYFNRLFWVQPDGGFEKYDKRHLFTYAGEDKIYTAGKDKLIVELKGWKICPQICYDIRFPAWNRNQEDYDLLFFVANWPERRSYPWRQLLIARAIENMSYTIGVNRVGVDANGINHSGNSMLVDPLGEILFEQVNTPIVKVLNLSKENLNQARERFGFLEDRDGFEINIDE